MRTSKIFACFLLVVILAFSGNNVNAQNPKTETWTDVFDFSFWIGDKLFEEMAHWEIITEQSWSSNGIVLKTTGTVTGLTTGTVYQIREVYHYSSTPIPGENERAILTWLVFVDGKLLGKTQSVYHYIEMPNGEWSVVNKWGFQIK